MPVNQPISAEVRSRIICEYTEGIKSNQEGDLLKSLSVKHKVPEAVIKKWLRDKTVFDQVDFLMESDTQSSPRAKSNTSNIKSKCFGIKNKGVVLWNKWYLGISLIVLIGVAGVLGVLFKTQTVKNCLESRVVYVDSKQLDSISDILDKNKVLINQILELYVANIDTINSGEGKRNNILCLYDEYPVVNGDNTFIVELKIQRVKDSVCDSVLNP